MHDIMFEVALHGDLLMVARMPSKSSECNDSGITPAPASHMGEQRAGLGVDSWVIGAQRQSEQGVIVGGPLWNRLQDIPVFDDLAVL
jgi:hypothetical protein